MLWDGRYILSFWCRCDCVKVHGSAAWEMSEVCCLGEAWQEFGMKQLCSLCIAKHQERKGVRFSLRRLPGLDHMFLEDSL